MISVEATSRDPVRQANLEPLPLAFRRKSLLTGAKGKLPWLLLVRSVIQHCSPAHLPVRLKATSLEEKFIE